MATLDILLSVGADDAHIIDDLAEFHGTEQFLFWGMHWLNDDEFAHAVLRFPNVTIPQGATITAAYLEFTATDEGADEGIGDPILSKIIGIDEDDHVAPTTYAAAVTDFGLATTAQVDWDFTGLGSGTLTSPSIVSIIQEIVNRGGWSSGNAIGIQIRDDGTAPAGDQRLQCVASVEDAATAPNLHIEYVAGESVDLYPTADGTDTDVVDEGDATTDLFASIDDDPSSPSDGDWNNNTDDAGQAFYELTNMPSDFDEAVSATILVRYRGQEFDGSGTVTLYARLYQSDESTPLSDEVQVASVTADTSFTNTSAVAFTGIVASDKTTWDGARLRLRWERT